MMHEGGTMTVDDILRAVQAFSEPGSVLSVKVERQEQNTAITCAWTGKSIRDGRDLSTPHRVANGPGHVCTDEELVSGMRDWYEAHTIDRAAQTRALLEAMRAHDTETLKRAGLAHD